MLAECGLQVDHVTIYRWVQRFTPLLIDATRPAGTCQVIGGSWTRPMCQVAGRWVYLYRAIEVTSDQAPAYLRGLDELLPAASHITEQYANNPIEVDPGQLKARLRPMRGLKQLRSARVISVGHAFMQDLRRSHYELGVVVDPHQLPAVFTELVLTI